MVYPHGRLSIMAPGVPPRPASTVMLILVLALVVVFAATTGILADNSVYWCSAGPVVLLGSVTLIAYTARRLEIVNDLTELIRSVRDRRGR
jgi:hypothetical protein